MNKPRRPATQPLTERLDTEAMEGGVTPGGLGDADPFPSAQATLRSTFRYKIVRRLGDGGMGRAFLAHEYDSIDTFRLVALKMLHAPEDEALQKTFSLEARLMRLMNHPNILTVHGFEKGTSGVDKFLSTLGVGESYASFLVMEYVAGFNVETLIRLHKQKGIYMLPQVAAYLTSRIARGLAYAHEFKFPGISAHGVVHRDITPTNVLIHEDGRLKISDFGIAYPYDPETANPKMCGTPVYIAPEVLAGEKPTAVSDVYSAGLLLEQMLIGNPRYLPIQNQSGPQMAKTQYRRALKHKFQGEYFRGVPQRLVAICYNATTTSPDTRYQSGRDLAVDLEIFLRDFDCALGPQQMAAYMEAIQSPDPGKYQSREFIMFNGREHLVFTPFGGGKRLGDGETG